MPLSQRDAQALDTALVAAPFIADGWQQALALLARVSGARGGQLIGISKSRGLAFHVEAGFSATEMEWLERMGGYVREANPRIPATVTAKPLEILSEPEFTSAEYRGKSALYQDVLVHFDADLSCIGQLNPIGDVQVGMCVVRPGRLGHYSDADRAALRRAMPGLDAAIRLHMAVEQRGAQLAGQAFDTLGAAAFLFDRAGRVIALSQAGEHMVREAQFLCLSHGVLTATDPRSNAELQRAILESCAAVTVLDTSKPVVLRGVDAAFVVEIARMPQEGTFFGSGAAAILVVPRASCPANARATIAAAFGLTGAEADIALMISEGIDVQAIAVCRRSSPQTVRSQLKTILGKTGARSQTHLAALVAKAVRL